MRQEDPSVSIHTRTPASCDVFVRGNQYPVCGINMRLTCSWQSMAELKCDAFTDWLHLSSPTAVSLPVFRYQKFRKLGQFEEWVVRGADWRNTRSERSGASGVRTDAGTWALNETEASYIEASVSAGQCLRHLQEAVGSKLDRTLCMLD